MKKILIMLLFSFSVNAEFLPVDFCFWDDNNQKSCEGDNFKVGKNLSNGYFEYHRISEVYKENPYLYYPNISVGLSDCTLIKIFIN